MRKAMEHFAMDHEAQIHQKVVQLLQFTDRLLREGMTLEEKERSDKAGAEIEQEPLDWDGTDHPNSSIIMNYAINRRGQSDITDDVYDKVTNHIKICEPCRRSVLQWLEEF